ncbi:hypothetical protein [Microbispora sp. GKU 823]|uniref:hypothetical protein n=1 Tax=Microbispora sp. GKU 823 TaxID=1652100 RepID=UPI0009A33C3F|nr:hypothetical protein [Microbispora sp. GKU 823]OPG13653.1 hypothetical protein B1L11_06610 [Microbispora sp. GKU 823]
MTRPPTKVIDQDGKSVIWAAVYMRYGVQGQEEYASLDEAVACQVFGRDYNAHAPMHILGPDGAVVLDGEELEEAMRKWREDEQREIEP